MARILICDTHTDALPLLERMVARLGHEPIPVRMPTPEQLMSANALIVEPATPIGLVLAQAASIATPSLPLICAGVSGPPAELAGLVVFAASLVKPFTIEQLRAALEQAHAA